MEEMCKYNMIKRGFLPVKKECLKAYYTENDVVLPKRATAHSAGYDFVAPYSFAIEPGKTKLIFTDVKAHMQDNEVLKIYIRSSLAVKKGIVLVNSVGIIDKDYFNNPDNDGNIGLCLWNTSKTHFSIIQGERIVQGIFEQYMESSNCNGDEKRVGGFGSTDK